MKKAGVDIETIPCEDPYLALQPFIKNLHGKSSKAKPGSGLKGLVESGTKADEVVEKAALSPVASRILAIGVYVEVEDENPLFGKSEFHFIYDNDEKVMLNKFIDVTRNISTLVTFNGRSFDFPFLMFRAAVHGIPLSLDIYPYNKGYGHIDLFVHLNQIGCLGNLDQSLRMVGLKKWLEYFGIGSKLSIADGQINLNQLHRDGNTQAIRDYLENDVMRTWDLYKRFEGNFK